MIDGRTEQRAREICRQYDVEYSEAVQAWTNWRGCGRYMIEPKHGPTDAQEFEAFMRKFCQAHAAAQYLLL